MFIHTDIAPHAASAEKIGALHTWLPEPLQTLVNSYLHLLGWLDHRERLRTLDAHMARDTGLQFGSDERFGNFQSDPRLFWNIGHTPSPKTSQCIQMNEVERIFRGPSCRYRG